MKIAVFHTIAIAVLLPAVSGLSQDGRLIGGWGRSESAYSPGLDASASAITFERLEFAGGGRCVYRSWTAVSADAGGASAYSRDGEGSASPGHWDTADARLRIEYENGNVLDASYSIFLHEGQEVLKVQFDGGRKLYYYRQSGDAPPPRSAGRQATTESGPAARLVAVRPDYECRRGGELGLLLSVTFEVENARGQEGEICVFFADRDGAYLKDFDDAFANSQGLACVSKSFEPLYEATKFSDVELFIPYSQLHLAAGRWELQFQVEIHLLQNGDKLLANSEPASFWVETK